MKMDEYLKKKNELQDKQKGVQDKIKELEDAKKKAKELEDDIKAEKKKEMHGRIKDFSLLGMKFRPWTLNDMVIVLFIIAILVVGGVSFMPGGEISSDVDAGEKVGFFTKLFGGFTVKSIDNKDNLGDQKTTSDDSTEGDSNQDTGSEDATDGDAAENVGDGGNLNYEIAAYYSESPFSKLNITGINFLWYNLVVRNKEGFVIHCKGNNYQDNTKIGAGEYYHDFTIRPLSNMEINTKINKGEDPKTIMEHRFSCYKEDGGGMKTDSSLKLVFTFN